MNLIQSKDGKLGRISNASVGNFTNPVFFFKELALLYERLFQYWNYLGFINNFTFLCHLHPHLIEDLTNTVGTSHMWLLTK